MSKRKVIREKIQLDNIFYIPDDVKNFEYISEDLVEYSDQEIVNDTYGEVIDETGDTLDLPVPQTITIVSQSLRKDFAGTDLVDVTFEVDDFTSVKFWNVRYVEV